MGMEEKNDLLKTTRNISFEDVILSLQSWQKQLMLNHILIS